MSTLVSVVWERDPCSLSCVMWFSTVLTSHVWVYLGWGGLEFYTPIKSCFTRGCWPTGMPSTRKWVVEIVEHIRLTEQSCKPSWNSDVMKSKNDCIPQEIGSASLLWHQPLHCFHLDWYAMLVPLLHPTSNNCKVSSETPVVACCCMLLLEIYPSSKSQSVEVHQWMHLALGVYQYVLLIW